MCLSYIVIVFTLKTNEVSDACSAYFVSSYHSIVASIVTCIAQSTPQIYMSYFFFLLLLFQQKSLLIRGENEVWNDWTRLHRLTCLWVCFLQPGFANIFFSCFINYCNNDASISYNLKGVVLCMITTFSDPYLVMMCVEPMMLKWHGMHNYL